MIIAKDCSQKKGQIEMDTYRSCYILVFALTTKPSAPQPHRPEASEQDISELVRRQYVPVVSVWTVPNVQ